MTDAAAPTPAASPRKRMFALSWWMPLAVFASAYVVRIFQVGKVVNFLDDRYINVPAAFNYVHWGITGPDNWFTQPAKHLFMYWNILAFGNDPVGWSMRQVLFGAGTVLVAYLLARRVFRAQFPALLTAALLCLDPLSIAFSRAGSEDPPAVFFMLAAMLFWVRALDEGRDLDWLAAGALIGVAAATRWYALLVALVMFVIALYVHRRASAPTVWKLGALLSVVPLSAYVVWFLPWMSRGYALSDLASLQLDSYLVQSTGAYPTFDPALARLTQPLGWFTRWIGVGTSAEVAGGSGAFTVMMNNPVLWMLFVPAIAFVAWTAYRRRLPEYWLIAGSFAVLYGFFALVDRPIYIYSALSVVPLGVMALGFASGRLLKKWSFLLLGAAVAWSLYLYPLTSSIAVPLAPYSWLLNKVGLLGGGG